MTQFFFTLYIMFVGPTGIDFVKIENAQFMNRETCIRTLPMARASMGKINYAMDGVLYKSTLVCLPYKLGEDPWLKKKKHPDVLK